MRKFRLFFLFSAIGALAFMLNSSEFWSLFSLSFNTEEYRFPVVSEMLNDQEHEASLNLNLIVESARAVLIQTARNIASCSATLTHSLK